jgi:hypothetical protein
VRTIASRGQSPHVRWGNERAERFAFASPAAFDPLSLRTVPARTVAVPAAGRVVAFDQDANGTLVALRQARRRRGAPERVLALVGGRWRAISPANSSAVDAKLAVADSGAAVAAWLQYDDRRVYVTAAVRPAGAGRFGPAIRISGATGRIPQPLAVAVGDHAEAVVAFAERKDLWMVRAAAGGPFATPVRIHDQTETTAGAFATAAAILDDTAVVVFTRLEDLEPPQYRATAATLSGAAAPLIETVDTDVSALDIDAAVDGFHRPLVATAKIGPPHSLTVHRRDEQWNALTTIPTQEAPSEIDLAVSRNPTTHIGVVWTELTTVSASIDRQPATKLADKGNSPSIAVDPLGNGLAAWDTGGTRAAIQAARFTPSRATPG